MQVVVEGEEGRGAGRGGIGRDSTVWAANATVETSHGNNSFLPSPSMANSNSGIGILGLSSEQRYSLLSLLNNHTNSDELSSKMNDIWILDSRCTHYMTSRTCLFENLQPRFPHIVRLPNGAEAAIKKGTVKLGPSFIVHDMLFIPNLKCNLILLGQIIDDTNCFVTLSPNLCIIKDHTSSMSIGRVNKEIIDFGFITIEFNTIVCWVYNTFCFK